MTFESYFDIIVNSARETGYNAFLPSLCVVEEAGIVMKVLDGDLSAEGDELRANEWAANFMKAGKTMFLAFRRGNRIIRVQQFLGSEPIRAKHFILDPLAP